jgi:hypothetical protein
MAHRPLTKNSSKISSMAHMPLFIDDLYDADRSNFGRMEQPAHLHQSDNTASIIVSKLNIWLLKIS